MATLALTPQDNAPITEIASRIRRQPHWVLSLLVSSLVHEASERWRGAQDLLEVTDEVPVTAWVVRRKSDLLLPGAAPEEDVLPEEPIDAAPWLSSATGHLRALQAQAAHLHARRPCLVPKSPAPVKGASPWKLAWSWPKLKIPTAIAPRLIQPEVDPVRERLARIRHRLTSAPLNGLGFDELVDSPQTIDRIMTFLALTQLWHTNELTMEQSHAYGKIWVRPDRLPR